MAHEIAHAGSTKAFFHKGASDFLLVTFNDAGDAGRTDGTGYWGQKLVEKADISCLGIVTTKRNWYAPEEMEELAGLLRPVLETYGTIIAYGNSMGGYAALRFSRLLGATHVLAVAPQASIDPEVVRDFDQRYLKSFDGTGGRLIRPEHLGGRIWVAYDPRLPLDVGHVGLITKAQPDARLIPVPYLGHNAIFVLRGSERIASVLRGIVADDRDGIRRLIHRVRREPWHYAYYLAQAVAKRRPQAVLDEIRTGDRLRHIPKMQILNLTVRLLLQTGRADEALSAAVSAAEKYPKQVVGHSRNISAFYNAGAYIEAEALLGACMTATEAHPKIVQQQRRVESSAREHRRIQSRG